MFKKIFSINFEFVPESMATISVMERGFLYGDSVYEVVRNYDHSKSFLMDLHYERLLKSSQRIGITVPFSLEKIRTHVDLCLEKLAVPNAYVRFIVTGGVDDNFHLGYRDSSPQTIVIGTELQPFPSRFYMDGLHVNIASVVRNHRKALDPNIKSGNYLNNVLAAADAKSQNYDDTVLLNLDGNITEASNSNVFMVKDRTVISPDEPSGLLEGISRRFLIELMKKNNIPYSLRPIPLDEFLRADEIFVTSTLKEVMPVTKVNGRTIGNGAPGEHTKKLARLFEDERNLLLGK